MWHYIKYNYASFVILNALFIFRNKRANYFIADIGHVWGQTFNYRKFASKLLVSIYRRRYGFVHTIYRKPTWFHHTWLGKNLGYHLHCYLFKFMHHKEKELFLLIVIVIEDIWKLQFIVSGGDVIIRLYHCFQYTARVVAQVIEVSVASYS